MVPKWESSSAGNSDMPKRGHKVLPLSEKVKVLNLIKKKNHMLRLLRSTARMNLLSVKLQEGERNLLVLLSHLTLQKLWSQLRDKCLVKMERH